MGNESGHAATLTPLGARAPDRRVHGPDAATRVGNQQKTPSASELAEGAVTWFELHHPTRSWIQLDA